MKKVILVLATLVAGGVTATRADERSNGIIVTATADTAVAANRTVALECAANQAVAKLIWHVDHLGWSGGDNVTSLRFSGKDVLAALGGGAIQHVTARCSALDTAGSEVAHHDTVVTVYDPTHPDALEPNSGAQAYVVPAAMTRLAGAQTWDQSGRNVHLLGLIDPLPLGPEEAWRRPNFVTAAMVKGKVGSLNPYGELVDSRNQHFIDYCRSALQPDPFPCATVIAYSDGRYPWLTVYGTQGIDYTGEYTLGFKVSRTLPLGPGYTATQAKVPYESATVELEDAALGQSYQVAATEWGLVDFNLGDSRFREAKDDYLAIPAHYYGNGTKLDPYLFYLGDRIGANVENMTPATEFPASTQIDIPVVDVVKRLVYSTVSGQSLTMDNLRNNYRLQVAYQVQGDTGVDLWTSGVDGNQTFHIKAAAPGRAVLSLGLRSHTGAVASFLVTFVFK